MDMLMLARRRSFTTLLFLMGSAGAACAPNSGNQNGGGSAAAAGTGTGSGGSGAGGSGGTTTSSSSGGSGASDGGGTGFIVPTGGAGGSSGGGDHDACASTSASVERTTVTKTVTSPVAIYLVQDRSGSMKDTPAGASASKWDQTTTADNAFVADPLSSGLDVALGFFPTADGQCNGTGYDTPAVALARLPSAAQVTAVANALTSNAPGGRNTGTGTPLEGGLRGGENFCLTYQANNPQERCVVVLITDGAPNGCASDQATLASIASDAKSQANILTFTIGMDGADFGLLDAIAVAGGSNCNPPNAGSEACNVAAGGTSLVDALNLIRTTVTQTQVVKTALPCEYTIPPAEGGQTFDRNEVNVHFTNASQMVEKLLQVKSSGDCANYAGQGWYYDDPTTPTKVELCPSTCTDAEGASAGDSGPPPHVDILFGCATEVAIPS
jgi:hypothetical protein